MKVSIIQSAGPQFTSPVSHEALHSAFSAEPFQPIYSQKLKLSLQTCRFNRRGAAIVEFAFVAPLLFFLLIGILEFGNMAYKKTVITAAAREGARKAAQVGTDTDGEVTAVINTILTAGNVSGQNTSINPSPSVANKYDLIDVTISVRYGQVSLLGDAGLDAMSGEMFGINFGTIGGVKNKNITATMVMAKEDHNN